MKRRIAAGLIVLVGVVYIATTITESLFPVGSAFEELTDGFRPIMDDEVLAELEGDVADLEAVNEEFSTVVVPAVSLALQMSTEEFGAFMQSQFPAVATGVQALPDILHSFEGIVGLLQSQVDNFEGADGIPVSSLPATTVPLGLLLAGIIAIAVGALMFLRPGRVNLLVAVVLGLVLLVGPLVIWLPGKSTDADNLNDALKPVYNRELVTGAREALGVVGGMGLQLQTQMLPTLANELQMDGDQLNAFFADNFPATAAALQSLPAAAIRFQNVVQIFDDNLENYETVKPVTLNPIVWMVVLGGLVVLAAGGWALYADRNTTSTANA